MNFITTNWEWVLLALYVVEKCIKLSPTKADDVVPALPGPDLALFTALTSVQEVPFHDSTSSV